MRTIRAWLIRVGGLFFKSRRERELAAEIESHLQLHFDDNIRAGMSPDEARRAARVKFGSVEAARCEYRVRAGIPLVENFTQDLRYALRRLLRLPGFSLLIVLTFALGVGANAAMFHLVNTLMFWRPAHVGEIERLVDVTNAHTYVRYQDLRSRLSSVELTAYTDVDTLSLGRGADAMPIRTACVTSTFFSTLGVAPFAGRTFAAVDERTGSEPTVVISQGFWARQFGAHRNILGGLLSIAGQSCRVIGIAPRGFAGLERKSVDAWILMAVSPEACSPFGINLLRATGGGWLSTVGRLGKGVSLAQAQAELAAAEAGNVPITQPKGRGVDRRAKLRPWLAPKNYVIVSEEQDKRVSLWLACGAGVLLLLACANIAGLLSMRAVERRHEIGMRLQLGASRRRVFAQLVTEHLVTVLVGGLAAMAVAVWSSALLQQFFPSASEAGFLDFRTIGALAALSLIAALLSGTLPALHASRGVMAARLRTSSGVVRGTSRARTALLVAQVALALVLVVGAGLFVQSVQNFHADFAYDLDRVATAAIDFRRAGNPRPEVIRATFELLLERVQSLPQIEAAALVDGSILYEGVSHIYGISSTSQQPPEMCALQHVSPDYFKTAGLRITRGRSFRPADTGAIVLNEALATKLFPGQDPIGKSVLTRPRKTPAEVVGVSEGFRSTIRPNDQDDSRVFMPFDNAADPNAVPDVLLVRTRGPSSRELPAIAAALQGASRDLPYVKVQPLLAMADTEARSWLLGATVFGLFGTLAAILAAVGIYGALAFFIRQRTTEIGLRMALGATRGDLVRMVLRQAAIVAAAGTVLGAAGAFAASRFAGSVLFNIAPADPKTFFAAAATLILATLAGCLFPAVRASRVDPSVALRDL